MMKTLQLATLLVLLAVAPPAGAYGRLEPLNELGTTLRQNVTDPGYAALDQTLASQDVREISFTRVRIDYADGNRTWHFYDDKDKDGVRDEGEEHFSLPMQHARFDGNGTDHMEVNLTQHEIRFRVCANRASEGIDVNDPPALPTLDWGFGRGLRCGGDLDRDGTADTTEINNGRNPVKPRDDALPTLP